MGSPKKSIGSGARSADNSHQQELSKQLSSHAADSSSSLISGAARPPSEHINKHDARDRLSSRFRELTTEEQVNDRIELARLNSLEHNPRYAPRRKVLLDCTKIRCNLLSVRKPRARQGVRLGATNMWPTVAATQSRDTTDTQDGDVQGRREKECQPGCTDISAGVDHLKSLSELTWPHQNSEMNSCASLRRTSEPVDRSSLSGSSARRQRSVRFRIEPERGSLACSEKQVRHGLSGTEDIFAKAENPACDRKLQQVISTGSERTREVNFREGTTSVETVQEAVTNTPSANSTPAFSGSSSAIRPLIPIVPVNRRLPTPSPHLGSQGSKRAARSRPEIYLTPELPMPTEERIRKYAYEVFRDDAAVSDIVENWKSWKDDDHRTLHALSSQNSSQEELMERRTRGYLGRNSVVPRKLRFEDTELIPEQTENETETDICDSHERPSVRGTKDGCALQREHSVAPFSAQFRNAPKSMEIPAETEVEVVETIVETVEQSRRLLAAFDSSESNNCIETSLLCLPDCNSYDELLETVNAVESLGSVADGTFSAALLSLLDSIPSCPGAGNIYRLNRVRTEMNSMLRNVTTTEKLNLGYAELLLANAGSSLWYSRMAAQENEVTDAVSSQVLPDATDQVRSAITLLKLLLEKSEGSQRIRSRLGVAYMTYGDICMRTGNSQHSIEQFNQASELLVGRRRTIALYKSSLASEIARGMRAQEKLTGLHFMGIGSLFS